MLKLKKVSKFYYSKGMVATGFTKVSLDPATGTVEVRAGSRVATGTVEGKVGPLYGCGYYRGTRRWKNSM